MVFDSLKARVGGQDNVTPMQIAHNSLFTAREKIELLNQLKADVTGAQQEGRPIDIDTDEIDAAIAEVHQGVQDGVGSETVLKGDF